MKAYRLVGYENRRLNKEDFNDDQKDAGEIGAGHTVTALYEIVPPAAKTEIGSVDALKYQEGHVKPSDELVTIKLRYKEPEKSESRLITRVLKEAQIFRESPSGDFKMAGAVAEWGMLLRNSEYKANATYGHVLRVVEEVDHNFDSPIMESFIDLVRKSETLSKEAQPGVSFKGEERHER